MKMASMSEKDLRADAKNFCESLGNVFMMKKRDPQTQHLLQKSKTLIDALLQEKRAKTDRPTIPPKPARGGGGSMGQLWVKLDEMKRENDELKKKLHGKMHDEKSSQSKSQGPGEVIIAELHKSKTENESLRAQLEKAITSIKELEKVNLTVQDEFKRTKIAHDMAQKSLEKVKQEQRSLESSLNTVKTENDSLKMRLTNSVKPMKRADNRFVENINEKCRPSNIAILYNNLESQQWVDAKEALEDAGFEDEETVTQFLCEILMVTYSICTDLLTDIDNGISGLLKDPCKIVDSAFLDCVKGTTSLSDDLLHSIKEVLRQNYENIDMEPVAVKCKENLQRDEDWNQFEGVLSHKSIKRYMEQCACVTWQMVIQQTPMWLSINDAYFDEDMHKLWWSCDKSNAKIIKFFVWPALYDCKNGNLLVKGCVNSCSE
ncbi:uncharacterized protein LOC128556895 [Mercenaria mercenaria]|uniref:uncharacterized protein LOC128556895 n=1 Tax=Mercenaria mercenaria TaxID=6596 RepID=UPI00234F7AB0|nr:uncharacterized protein LOC128556895 [Mercenaria mercenaria]